MQLRLRLLLLALTTTIVKESKPAHANVLFRFALDFHVISGDSSEDEGVINKTLIFENNRVTVKNNLHPDEPLEEELTARPNELALATTTAGPLLEPMNDLWLQQQNLIDPTEQKLKEIVEALTKLNEEIWPVVGRSDFVSSKVKMINHYINILDASAAEALNSNTTTTNPANKFEYLRKFLKLADKLKEPPGGVNGGKRSMEYMVMKLELDKYQIGKLQAEVEAQVAACERAWQNYVESKVVEVTI
ncbi:uncharacterized protein LOC118736315 [Rhagoletis pomonella]|uniref:uncharacterized protein LOC118736315 n=1 Tax=Rhagoletis pomonella TaxID=28610 RepID=UPI001781C809|nr:uncharacterized protein LOC118736315 [Rhagoletis pomonella]XP_036322310.1 uncharacterized protein LOC118736315 [Rhagoletis pomonella]